jgi:hypothetical protein
VQAADYDHILFTANKTMYKYLTEDVAERNGYSPNSSLYFDQYWAIENSYSKVTFKNVEEYFKKSGGSKKYPIQIKTRDFDLLINNKDEEAYARKMVEFVGSLNETRQFRDVIVTFKHPYIYGQSLHNTRSSILVKLCEAGLYFRNGGSVKSDFTHFMHYRDYFNFNNIKTKNRFVSVMAFVKWCKIDRLSCQSGVGV